jgi:L-ornithine N5-oxygenase
VSAGQSAAEVAAYLPDGYSPSRTRVFDPDAVGGFYSADPGVRRQLINYHRSTNYSAVDLPLIEDLYAREYAERVAGNRRLSPRGASSVFEAVEDGDGVRVDILDHPTGAVEQIDCDAVDRRQPIEFGRQRFTLASVVRPE